MEVKRANAEASATAAASSETDAQSAQTASETALSLAQAARDAAQTYATQAFATTPTTIGENILLAQLDGGLFNGSTFDA